MSISKKSAPQEQIQIEISQPIQKTKYSEPVRPEVVRVFGRNFYITYTGIEGGMTNLGLTHYNESLVNIREDQRPIEEKDTLLHEFIHVIDHIMECELEERQVTILAHGLIGIFQDNPEFARYIIDEVHV
jgi:hypothetical protein